MLDVEVVNMAGDFFKHEPFEAAGQIRLLRILPTSTNDDICCLLEHAELEDDRYICLSYMWGTDPATHTIRINGRSFMVRSNLYHFLQKARVKYSLTDLRHSDLGGNDIIDTIFDPLQDRLWIDAICINQSNDHERAQQVRMMADIYSSARSVLVHLGSTIQIPAPANGEYLRDCINSTKDWPMNLCKQVSIVPYWHRMWIVQEILLAKKVFVLTKDSTIDPEVFIGMDAWNPEDFSDPFYSMMASRRINSDRRIQTIESLLPKYRRNHCSEPKDRIYALIGLTTIPPTFPIDYRRSDRMIFLDVLEHLVIRPEMQQDTPDCARRPITLAPCWQEFLLLMCLQCYRDAVLNTEPDLYDCAAGAKTGSQFVWIANNVSWAPGVEDIYNDSLTRRRRCKECLRDHACRCSRNCVLCKDLTEAEKAYEFKERSIGRCERCKKVCFDYLISEKGVIYRRAQDEVLICKTLYTAEDLARLHTNEVPLSF